MLAPTSKKIIIGINSKFYPSFPADVSTCTPDDETRSSARCILDFLFSFDNKLCIGIIIEF